MPVAADLPPNHSRDVDVCAVSHDDTVHDENPIRFPRIPTWPQAALDVFASHTAGKLMFDCRDDEMSIDFIIQLSNCLERRTDGAIAISGHRISLHQFLNRLFSSEVQTVGDIQSHFPTVPADKIRQVVLFCTNHAQLMRRYREDCEREADAMIAQHKPNGPTLNDLRTRAKQMKGHT